MGFKHDPTGMFGARRHAANAADRADGIRPVRKPIAQGICPYSGRVISSDPAMAAGEPIELDHIFPLSAAWDMGAYAWPMAKRLAFANDPANLVAVAKAENQAKSDSLPSEWLPSDSSRRCWYVNQLADIAVTYGLAVSAADAAVMRHQCPMG